MRQPLSRKPLGRQKAQLSMTITCLVLLIACSLAPRPDDTVRMVLKHFAEQGFPSNNTNDVMELMVNDRAGRTINANSEAFWYSRDGTVSIQFNVDGCPQSGDPPVTWVLVCSFRRTREAAARDVRHWLQIIHSPTMPPITISDDLTGKYFESTWSPGGRKVHVKAWVVQNDHNEWYGVLHIHPDEVIIISSTLDALRLAA